MESEDYITSEYKVDHFLERYLSQHLTSQKCANNVKLKVNT